MTQHSFLRMKRCPENAVGLYFSERKKMKAFLKAAILAAQKPFSMTGNGEWCPSCSYNFLHSSLSKFQLLVAGRMNKTAAKCFFGVFWWLLHAFQSSLLPSHCNSTFLSSFLFGFLSTYPIPTPYHYRS